MISEFSNYLVNLKGYSPRTAEGYVSDLRTFSRWMRVANPLATWRTITRDDLDAYLMARVEQGASPATTNRELASISALYRYFKRQGFDVVNPCEFESRRKVPQSQPNTIPIEDIKKAYEHASGISRLLLGLFTTTAMRLCEVLALDWRDIDYTEKRIKVHGKGSRTRYVYTSDEVLQPLRDMSQQKQPKGLIFNLSPRAVRRLIYNALRPYSNAEQLSPHAIRHTVATHIAREGVNVATLASILGHNHLETTQRYIDLGQMPISRTMQAHSIIN